MAGLNFMHGISQALYSGKLFHIDLNGQRGIKFDQDLVFGHGDLANAFALVDLLENGGVDGGPSYTGPRHFDYKPISHRGHCRSVGFGRGEHADVSSAQAARRGVPRRPRGGRGASRPHGSHELRRPTLEPGRDAIADLLADRSAYEDFDADSYFGAKGFGFVRLNQLALEHLMGAR